MEPGNGVDRDNYLKDRDVVTYLIKQEEPMRSKRRFSARPKVCSEDEPGKNKKSFRLPNQLVTNSTNLNIEEDIAIDWTPEIPFENVS